MSQGDSAPAENLPDSGKATGTTEVRGRPGRRRGQTSIDLAARNEQLVRDRLRGLPWAAICERYRLRDRQAREVFYRWRDGAKDIEREDPVAFVFEELARLETLYDALAEVAAEAVRPHDRIAALKSQASMRKETLALRQAAGLIPNLGPLLAERAAVRDWERMVELLFELFDRHAIPAPVVREFHEVLEIGAQVE